MNSKKIILSFVILLTILAGGCSNSNKDEFADKDFLKGFSKGLESRWNFTNKVDDNEKTEEEYVENLKKATNLELQTLNDFSNKKFNDSKLQEAAIAYINELKNGITVLDTYGSKSFDQDWDNHYASRTKMIVHFVDNYDINISEKYKKTLNELKAHGNEVIKNETIEKSIQALFNNVTFEIEPQEYESDYKNYATTIENTTENDINNLSATVNLLDNSGTIVDSQYLYADNWKKGQKFKFRFMSDKKFDKSDISIKYYEIK